MSKIVERILVGCPFNGASSCLDVYFGALDKTANGDTTVPLKMQLEDIGLPAGMTLSHDVVAQFAPVRLPEDPVRMTAIYWEPKGGGPFPKFLGTLTIQEADDRGSSWLEVEGDYVPPFGVLGLVFDTAVGHKIARVTVTTLLRNLKAAMEKCCAQALER